LYLILSQFSTGGFAALALLAAVLRGNRPAINQQLDRGGDEARNCGFAHVVAAVAKFASDVA
jgi:hypothetical protein